MAVRRWMRISNEDRERLVRAVENPNEDYLTVADTLGVHRSTARGIVATYIREGRTEQRARGGRNNVKIEDEMKECLNNIINENCMMTLTEFNQQRAEEKIAWKTRGARQDCWANFGRVACVKLARPLPAERNRPDVIEKRYEYGNWFMTTGILKHCIFQDEYGYNIWTSRSYGRARIGERAYRQVCGKRGRNVTIVMAVSPTNGLVHHSAHVGGMNGPCFNDFLAETRENIDPEDDVVFVYDNAPAQRNAPITGENTKLKPLLPYSPFLNIVEQAISSLKAAIKADLSRPAEQASLNNREEARRQGIYLLANIVRGCCLGQVKEI